MKEFSLIAAMTLKCGIGLNNTLPWKLKSDLKQFQEKTTRNAIIMGRKTWESLPKKPLPNRLNIIISKNEEEKDKALIAKNFHDALELAQSQNEIFVIGGSRVFECAVKHPLCTKLFITQILTNIECDTFMSPIDLKKYELTETSPVQHENGIDFQYLVYTKRHEEYQYLDLVREILDIGNEKGDRTGTGVFSVFGRSLTFSLRNGCLPLITTKKVYWQGAIQELLWMISGSTDSRKLDAKKCKIWNPNAKDFYDKGNVNILGDCGPIYGHQMRHCGAEYIDCETDYKGKGIDQLQELITTIKTNPNDRRLLMNLWNINDLKKMCLPPCHLLSQFYIANGELSCIFYMRSSDIAIGLPFNLVFYSILTLAIATVCKLQLGDVTVNLGDTHAYKNVIDGLKLQLTRKPMEQPTIRLKTNRDFIDEFVFEDFEVNYISHPAIKMEMAV